MLLRASRQPIRLRHQSCLVPAKQGPPVWLAGSPEKLSRRKVRLVIHPLRKPGSSRIKDQESPPKQPMARDRKKLARTTRQSPQIMFVTEVRSAYIAPPDMAPAVCYITIGHT